MYSWIAYSIPRKKIFLCIITLEVSCSSAEVFGCALVTNTHIELGCNVIMLYNSSWKLEVTQKRCFIQTVMLFILFHAQAT
ncbi:hypothetical protein F5Y01DRAFT_8616 [Xylaria sp. FL0043]|nr:hypothetical protein F5Y01DRAFT_8616 [Xylaria sp. FL0043]